VLTDIRWTDGRTDGAGQTTGIHNASATYCWRRTYVDNSGRALHSCDCMLVTYWPGGLRAAAAAWCYCDNLLHPAALRRAR